MPAPLSKTLALTPFLPQDTAKMRVTMICSTLRWPLHSSSSATPAALALPTPLRISTKWRKSCWSAVGGGDDHEGWAGWGGTYLRVLVVWSRTAWRGRCCWEGTSGESAFGEQWC